MENRIESQMGLEMEDFKGSHSSLCSPDLTLYVLLEGNIKLLISILSVKIKGIRCIFFLKELVWREGCV